MESSVEPWLRATEFLDHDSSQVHGFVRAAISDKHSTPVDKAVALYYAVRDGLFYEVYATDMSRVGLQASTIVESGQGFCVQKSILYAACLRAVGIPSKLVVTEVRNHLASDRLRRMVGGEVFVHMLNSAYLNGRWVRATPVFNEMLCRLYGMDSLEFDGVHDSMHHPFDDGNGRSMEFIREHGEFDDLPYDWLLELMRHKHPAMFAGASTAGSGSLMDEANSP
ncbi:transglutaminase-like domain-containing protein [Saccharopolyspora pogona]|uniref:transglutaminase-like domain-containing protein n=1 Tax=Saccharopolyspora pogona TaxID=333966 RepID=UPI001684B3B7|nr:transglutaminase-like domain-containing protein [Saccharopolyspora pogona]